MKQKMKKAAAAIALLAALVLLIPAAAAQYQSGFGDGSGGYQPVRTAPVMLIAQDGGSHIKYMNGSDGWFRPEDNVTRAELAQILAGVTADLPASVPRFEDVPQQAWYAPAVGKAAGLGLMTGADGFFRPDEPATRAECAAALALTLPYDAWSDGRTFPDVPTGHPAWQAISRTAAYGLFQGDDNGLFHPDDGLSRCEAAAVFNRLLGRIPDYAYMQSQTDLRVFPDVPPSHWAFADVMEASVTHQCTSAWNGREVWTSAVSEPTLVTAPSPSPSAPAPDPEPSQPALADGPQRIDGRLYWVVEGEFVREQSVSGLYFDENGCYTTGDAELDTTLNAIVEELTDDSMSRDQKLEVLFNYCRDNFKYLKRPLISKGQTGWEPAYAAYFLKNGKGNCYNFSAAYCLLCRELGLPAYTVVGRALNSPHGWVEIELDGAVYLFDPQLAWRYLHDWGRTGYNFFKQPAGKTTVQYTR